ncbi:MAG: NosD domain-containing protein [Candidatus Woesearchaeota archaeon]
MSVTLRLAACFFLSFMFCLVYAFGQTHYCDSCAGCTSQIQSQPAGSTIYLTTDLVSAATCIDFGGKDSVTLDCQGHSVTGSYSGNSQNPPPYTFGIYLSNLNSGSNNNVVKNCVVSKFYYGLRIYESAGNAIENVQVSGNFQNGFDVYYSSSNSIVGCKADQNSNRGIYIYRGDSNTVRNSVLDQNNIGFSAEYGSQNSLDSCQLSQNRIGVQLAYAKSNTVTGNHVLSSGEIGIGLYHDTRVSSTDFSSSNIIYNNLFRNNNNLYSSSELNQNTWHVQPSCSTKNVMGGPMLAGNFWGNPSNTGFSDNCADSDRNGICDSGISLAPGSADAMPLSSAADNIPPTAPTGLFATVVSSNQIDLSWAPSKDNSCLAGYNIYRDGSQIGTSTSTTYSDLGVSGSHTYNVAAYDTFGNLGPLSSSDSTNPGPLDTEPPVSVLNPYTSDPTNDITPTYTGSASDTQSSIIAVQYRIDAGAWSDAAASDGSFNSLAEGFAFTSSPLQEGLHIFEVRGQDSKQNMQATYTWDSLRIDTTAPNTLLSQHSPDPTADTTPSYSGSASDSASNIVAVQYRVDSGPWNLAVPSDGGFNSKNEGFAFTLPEVALGTHTIETRAKDAAGNLDASYASDTLTVLGDKNTCIAGDADCDGVVTIYDLVLVVSNYGQGNFDPLADLDGNGVVDTIDVVLVAQNYGKML